VQQGVDPARARGAVKENLAMLEEIPATASSVTLKFISHKLARGKILPTYFASAATLGHWSIWIRAMSL